ncbi:DDE transposase family protein [Zobellia galactanivorans]|uniref:DDE transposase family protein n=1 Tax=Zobellia galactanivorans (strain DSM 12802 / CCUG 47099 / CIP 106680 / NCIMB 13871 / Dsij) TaxID=63186 RepID=UPI0026E2E279|nr:DDE transposase family protein [Zobellia galactanivorans]MDO6808092.1 DDE transposase family protein [Zobellia galactanivorans]
MAASKETIQRKKDYAKLLYTVEGVTVGKELASRAGVSEQTISKWKNEEGWEQLRASVIITKESELKRLYAQIVELNDAIAARDQGHRFANSKEADVLVKLTSAVRQLETDTSVADAIEVLKDFISHVRQDDYELAMSITTVADGYVKTLMK